MASEQELRQKYREVLSQLETQEAQSGQLESVLRLLIGRLCLAGRGRDPRLDEELRKIGSMARHRLEIAQINAALEPLSRAVAGLDQIGSTDTVKTLRGPEPQPEPGAPDAPASRAAPAAGAMPLSTTQSQRALHASTQTHLAVPAAAAVSAAAGPEPHIHGALAQMLDRLSALPELRPAIAALHDRTFEDLSAEELAERVERVTNLIGEQRTSLLREKGEIEDMLRQIDSRLEAISAFFAFEDQDRTDTRDSSNKLNMLVMGEVNEISTDMTQAVSLSELRGRVGNRLEAINTHLVDFRNREEERLSAQVDRTMSLRKRVEELERESRVLQHSLQAEQRAAMIDALTGIANRAAYDDRMAHEFARWQRSGGTISIAAWDVDHFKTINDEYGHMAGDKVLRILGQHMARSVRGSDFLARYGGEEFVMIMVGVDSEQALKTCNRIRTGIQAIAFHFREKPVTVTASCGITTFRMGDLPETAFERADGALYEAKDAGRNRCVVR
ncbi:MAG TPA: diguanylate cyclase [Steroidobacteraceae bacterium]|nr:diguanylate cyclase [Steroidobacteraceae bacterium]